MNKKKSSIKNKKEITNRGYSDRNNTVERRGETRKRLLIVCEGQETEPNYFNSLYKNLNKIHLYIQVKGAGRVKNIMKFGVFLIEILNPKIIINKILIELLLSL
ncbi:MAG: RloB-like protein [Cyanobacteriota bacterium]